MASPYKSVSTRMWGIALRRTNPMARLVRAYVATGPFKTTEGLFPLPLGYITHDTGLTTDQVVEGLGELEAQRIVSWDPEHEVILDREALHVANYTSVADNRIVKGVKLVRDLPKTRLVDEFSNLARELAPPFFEVLRRDATDHERDITFGA